MESNGASSDIRFGDANRNVDFDDGVSLVILMRLMDIVGMVTSIDELSSVIDDNLLFALST